MGLYVHSCPQDKILRSLETNCYLTAHEMAQAVNPAKTILQWEPISFQRKTHEPVILPRVVSIWFCEGSSEKYIYIHAITLYDGYLYDSFENRRTVSKRALPTNVNLQDIEIGLYWEKIVPEFLAYSSYVEGKKKYFAECYTTEIMDKQELEKVVSEVPNMKMSCRTYKSFGLQNKNEGSGS